MNKRVLVIVLALAVLIGGSVAALALTRTSGPDTAAPPVAQARPSAAPSSTPAPTATPAPAPVVSPGVYEDYSDGSIADATAKGTTLLFFHAPWCGQCRDLESDILEYGVPDGVTIIKVDFDSRQDVRQQYDVNMRTTFVKLDASGTEVQRFVAYDTPSLDAVVAALL